MNKLALVLASAALVAPLAFVGPAAASHGPPYFFAVGIEKASATSFPAPVGGVLPVGCTFFASSAFSATITCNPPTTSTTRIFTCAYQGAYTTHHTLSVNSITTTSQCKGGPATVASAAAPNSAVAYNFPGDWDFAFTCTVDFDVGAAGYGWCWEGDP
jgi:hypothetical protein